MNTLSTIAIWLAASAVLQMVGFYCYSTYQKYRLLKTIGYENFNEDDTLAGNRPGGKPYLFELKEGGKVASIFTSPNSKPSPYSTTRSNQENYLPKQISQ